jgi:glucose-1-phosphatase
MLNPTKFVYFDLGNVLVTFDHRVAAANLATLCNLSVEKVFQQLFVTDLQERYETGLVSSQQYVEEINQTFGRSLSNEQVRNAISDMFEPNTPILQALSLVKQAKVPIGILSNTCEAHWKWLMDRDWPMLHGWYDKIMLSYEIGSMKPHPPIYEACEEACGLSGKNIFFTDDRADNIAAAKRRGWETHQFSCIEPLLEHLQNWLAD